MSSSTSSDPSSLHSLTSLISSQLSSSGGPSRRLYPSDDTITSILHSRSRMELPYTQISPSGKDYVIVNPLRMLSCLNDEHKQKYKAVYDDSFDGGVDDRVSGRDGSGEGRKGGLQPSIYDLAGRVWWLMRRRKESQGIIYRGLTGSGKSTSSQHLTSQILSLSSPSKPTKRLSDQINYFHTLLQSFGHSKTSINPSASQHSLYSELHFTSEGKITGAKFLPFGLNKSRISNISHDERSFHVFYQLLAGATPEERDVLGLEDPTAYDMLNKSGCFRLPGGPFSDDSTQLSELRVAFANLGFKAKHVKSIFTVLIGILVLSNLEFTNDRQSGSLGMISLDEKTRVLDRNVLILASTHLGVNPDDLEAVLVNRTRWVKRDLCSIFLDIKGAEDQRDMLMRDLYAILFTFIVEMANKKLCPPNDDAAPELQIVQLDLPGFSSKTTTDVGNGGGMGGRGRPGSMFQPLINASGENGFEEFSNNMLNEILHSYTSRRTFDDDLNENQIVENDGLRLPGVISLDNNSVMELLRGGLLNNNKLAEGNSGLIGYLDSLSENLKGDDRSKEEISEFALDSLVRNYGRHPSFIVSPGLGTGPLDQRKTFGINHYDSLCSYDIEDFPEKNLDVLDKQLVDLLRNSMDSFIAKLVSGPGLASEGHPLDHSITVEAQVSSMPLRTPTKIVNPLIGIIPNSKRSNGNGNGKGDWAIDNSVPQPVATQLNATLSRILNHMDQVRIWNVYCIRPCDSGYANAFDKRKVKNQVRSLLLPEIIQRRQVNWIADYSFNEFCLRHGLYLEDPEASVLEFVGSKGWTKGLEYEIGRERIWLCWDKWFELEKIVRAGETRRGSGEDKGQVFADDGIDEEYREGMMGEKERNYSPNSGIVALPYNNGFRGYQDQGRLDSPDGFNNGSAVWSERDGGNEQYDPGDSKSIYEKVRSNDNANTSRSPGSKGRKGEGFGGGGGGGKEEVGDNLDVDDFQVNEKKHIQTEVVATTRARRWWLRIVWSLTWWIPSFLLSSIGKMKRADIRMAWREKLAIFLMVILLCGTVLFYIIVFGIILCPDKDKAWNTNQLHEHQGRNDYYAAIAGVVYDFTNFYKGQHSDIQAFPVSADVMLQFAGQDLTQYFPPAMTIACSGLVTNQNLQLQWANFTPILDYAVHRSGPLQTNQGTKLNDINWYSNRLQPDLKQYWKGYFVFSWNDISSQAESASRSWAVYKNQVFDLSDYLYTKKYYSSSSGTDLPNYSFLPDSISGLFQTNSGQDISKQMDSALAGLTQEKADQTMQCLNNVFYRGQMDYRDSARCAVQNWLLLSLSIILCLVILMKFLAALQLGAKRHPEILDKFVICQVPCYTEGEESLKRTIDSLAVLHYDDKRKLIFIICDGNIIGSGNNRPTPRIVLDILGVDPKLDPEPLLFKSIGEGSKQLNYGKIYSGLYEHEGHVVPYVVVVKVGKPTETSKPGNRGKRDSQVLLLQYLNRVHFDAPMNPLELEIYHQMRNVIGIDPAFYEYIFQVDADTTVEPDSLNRLIACSSDDSAIIGICGETKLANERESLTTMIQVYEYFISHHLTKAFESLFGSVTCLPGCFSVYRIRTADKGRPVIISSIVIDEYAEPNVDTLHKKNLFSLGEDRYLTTLMMKHFPTYKMKFTPDAIAHTVAPSRWSVLLSQRRRWINSTVHNLVELMAIPELCGFCCFSMRFVVFIDLLGTITLPATCIYLIYMIIAVAIGASAVPLISLIMLASVYGLQMIIFILKREFMLIGWMLLYLLAFPIYSVYLPIYSFWSMDDFSWGSTRKVVGEGNNKTIVYEDDEPFNDSMIPYKSFKDYEANAWETQSLHSEKSRQTEKTNNSFRPPSNNRFQEGRHSRNISRNSSSASLVLPQGADYWRDSSPLGPSHSSANLRHMPSQGSLLSQGQGQRSSSFMLPQPTGMSMGGMGQQQRVHSMAGLSMWGGGQSNYDPTPPQQPFLQPMYTGMSGSPMVNHQNVNPFDSPSMYPSPGMGMGMMGMGAPRNSVMTNLNGFGGGMPNSQSHMSLVPNILGPGGGMRQSRMSSYSLAGNHPLADTMQVNESSSPDDSEVLGVLRRYLASQDLMSVTKRQTREAIYGFFPNANLQSRSSWINENIDKILSEA